LEIRTKASNEGNNRTAYLLSALARVAGIDKLRVCGKWYRHDPNTHRSDDERTVYVAGLSYDVSKEFMPFVAWRHQNGGNDSEVVDRHKYRIGFRFKH
jgi:hypothetical protein